MGWSIVGVGTDTSVFVDSANVNEPPSVCADGDLCVVAIGYRDAPAFTLPAGWNIIGGQAGGNTTVGSTNSIGGLVFAYRERSGSASANWARSGGGIALGQMVVYRPDSGSWSFVLGGGRQEASATATGTTGQQLPNTSNVLAVAAQGIGRNTSLSYAAFELNNEIFGGFPNTPDTTSHPSNANTRVRVYHASAGGVDVSLCMFDGQYGALAPGDDCRAYCSVSSSQKPTTMVGFFLEEGGGGGGGPAPGPLFPVMPFFGPERRRHGGFAPKRKGLIGWRPPQLLGADGRLARKAA